jgi:hypothetical protein
MGDFMLALARRAAGRSPPAQDSCHAPPHSSLTARPAACVARAVRPLASPAARRAKAWRLPIARPAASLTARSSWLHQLRAAHPTTGLARRLQPARRTSLRPRAGRAAPRKSSLNETARPSMGLGEVGRRSPQGDAGPVGATPARLELMKMKLPEAPAELLQDTLPPNGAMSAPPASAIGDATEDSLTTEAPVVDSSRLHQTVIIPRVRRQQRLRSVVIAAVCAGVALLAIGFVVTRRGETSEPQQEHPADVQVSPVPAAAEGEGSPAEAPTAPAAEPQRLDDPAPAAETAQKGVETPPSATRGEQAPRGSRSASSKGRTAASTGRPSSEPPAPQPAGTSRKFDPSKLWEAE